MSAYRSSVNAYPAFIGAAYLELAMRRRLPPASCDNALLAAAARRNVAVLAA